MRGIGIILILLIATFPFASSMPTYIGYHEKIAPKSNKPYISSTDISTLRKQKRDTILKTFTYLENPLLKPRNLSDLIFKYYTNMNEPWNYKPDVKIEWVYKIADGEYKSYLSRKYSYYAESFITISYLAYLFRNQTYIQEAEDYWNWLYQTQVNHTTFFMNNSKDRAFETRLGAQWVGLYLLWKTTNRDIYLNNLTRSIHNYEDIVLEELEMPIGGRALLTYAWRNSTGELVPAVRNDSKSITRIGFELDLINSLILFSDLAGINKTLLAIRLNTLIKNLAYYHSSTGTWIMHEGLKATVYNNSGTLTYSLAPIDYTNIPGYPPECRKVTQKILPSLWANRTHYDPEVSEKISNLAKSMWLHFYKPNPKFIRYSYYNPNYVVWNVPVGVSLSSLILNDSFTSQILNATMNHLLVWTGNPNNNAPLSFFTRKRLLDSHLVIADFYPELGKYSTEVSTLLQEFQFDAYKVAQDYLGIQVLAWLSGRWWISLSPLYYVALTVVWENSTRSDGFYGEYRTDTGWNKMPAFAYGGGYNLFVLFGDGIHPDTTERFLLGYQANGEAGGKLVSYVRFSPYNQPDWGEGNFTVNLTNIYIPSDRASFIFTPSDFHIKAVMLETIDGTYTWSYPSRGSLYTISGRRGVFGALSDNVIVFNPLYFGENAGGVVNISILFANFTFSGTYYVSETEPISWAYNLTYGRGSGLDPEADYDGDGVPAKYEVLFMSDPYRNDTDGDGLSDAEEIYFFINPVNPDADCDGLTDYFELYGATKWSQYLPHELDPRRIESYNHTYSDFFYGYVLENQTSNLPNWDEYGYNETEYRMSLDTDGDLVSNYEEYYILGTDPFDSDNIPDIIIYCPENNSAVSGLFWLNFSISWFTDTVKVYINGSVIYSEIGTNIGGSKSIQISTGNYNKGLYNITVLVSDMCGTNTSTIFVYFPPVSLIVNFSNCTNETLYRNDTLLVFNVSVVNASYVTFLNISVYVNDTPIYFNSVLADWYYFEVNVSEFGTDKYYVIRIMAFENTSSDEADYMVGVYSIADCLIISPENGTIVADNETINISIATDWHNNNVSLLINGSVLYSWENIGPGNLTYILNTRDYADGNYVLNLTLIFNAFGKDFLVNRSIVFITIDNIPNILSVSGIMNQTLYWTVLNSSLNITVEIKPFGGLNFNNITLIISNNTWSDIYSNETYDTLFTFTVDLTNLSGGYYNVTISVYDNDGDSDIWLYMIAVYHEAETTILKPHGYFIENNAIILFNTTSDWINITAVIYLNDTVMNETYGIISPDNETILFTLDTTMYPDGRYNITVIITAIAFGEEYAIASDSRLVYIDNNAPILTVVGLTNETIYNNITFNISIFGETETSFVNLTVLVNGTSKFNTTKLDNYTINLQLDTGYCNIRIIAWDVFRKTETAYIIGISKVNPSIKINIPENNTIVHGKVAINISTTYDWIDTVIIVYLDGLEYEKYNQCGTILINIDTTMLLDGTHNITALLVRNFSGKIYDRYKSMVIIIVDNTPPIVEILSPHGLLNRTTITVVWNGSDESSGIDHYVLYVDGILYNDSIPPSQTNYTIMLSEGIHNITVRAVDISGNIAEDTVWITIDITPPTIFVVEPQNNSVFDVESIDISWFSPDADIVEYILLINSDVIYRGNSTTYSVRLEDGTHLIIIRVIDQAGNTAESRVMIVVDTLAPIVKIVSPTEEYVNRSTINITWYIEEANVERVELRINYGEWITTNETYYIANLSDGKYIIELRVVDIAGHVGKDRLIFTVDTAPPIITILEPENNTMVDAGEVKVKISVVDTTSGVAEILINTGDGWRAVEEGTISIGLKEGTNRILIKAIDNAGNIKKVCLVLIHKKQIIGGIPKMILIAIVIAICIVVVGALRKKAKKNHRGNI